MEHATLIRIATYFNRNEAYIMATKLQAFGVQVYLRDDVVIWSWVACEYPLVVHRQDVDKAKEILYQPVLRIV